MTFPNVRQPESRAGTSLSPANVSIAMGSVRTISTRHMMRASDARAESAIIALVMSVFDPGGEVKMAGFVIVSMFVGIIALMIFATVWRGYVLSILWGWFAVPILHLPPLTIAQAIAVSLLAGMLSHQYVPTKDKETWQPAFFSFVFPAVSLAMGWIVKSYLP